MATEQKKHSSLKLPAIGFGTWKIPTATTVDNVDLAIELGFNHIDTAQAYGNETETGQAIKESGLKREDIWVTTKWSGAPWGAPSIAPLESIHSSLSKLNLSHIDLYLIHTPRLLKAGKSSLREGWNDFARLQTQYGLTKHVGISNFTLEDCKELLEGEKKVETVPFVNQIELHPYNYAQQLPLVNYCQAHNIIIEAYSPLKPLTTYPTGPLSKPLKSIAERLNVPQEAVLLAWVRSKGAVALTTSRTKERLETYLKSQDLELEYDDILAIEKAAAKGPKYVCAGLKQAVKRSWVVILLAFLCSAAFWGMMFLAGDRQ